ncbi:hypothetical protein V8G54_037375 [Vigna mungo]|uniref:Wall-associated receptor kinase galacturonan-binding domain-containing protein n=1 Tax=Vigna mungo TaxID=3915 RepID=A0AAQ3MII7_VIGMU
MENEGWSRCSCSAGTLVSVLATIILLLQPDNCLAKRHPPCPTSSCGQIRNISYPFRLKGDPGQCGDPRYELDCVNNATLILTLFSEKYLVLEIDYKGYKIVLRDPGQDEDSNCSFIPRYFFTNRSLWNSSLWSLVHPLKPIADWEMVSIGYLNCLNPVNDDPRYVKVDRSGCGSGGHVYAILGYPYYVIVQDIKVGCDVMVATLWQPKLNITYHKCNDDPEIECGEVEVLERISERNVTYGDIQRKISEGFWLSWLPIVCEDRCGKGTECDLLNEYSGEVRCRIPDCRYNYYDIQDCGG